MTRNKEKFSRLFRVIVCNHNIMLLYEYVTGRINYFVLSTILISVEVVWLIYICHKSSGYCLYSELISLQDGSVSIQDKFEYIMHGRLYNITKPQLEEKECSKPQLEVYVNIYHVMLVFYSIFSLQKYHLRNQGCLIKPCFTWQIESSNK